MRSFVFWSFLLYAAHPVHAGCDSCFFRINQLSGEAELFADTAGYIEWTNALTGGTATVEKAVTLAGDNSWNTFVMSSVTSSWSRVRVFDPEAPGNMVLIPAGIFHMGSDPALFPETSASETPVHPVSVSEIYMDATEVTKAVWDEVWSWAVTNGYSFDRSGEGNALDHPVHSMTWYDAVKWCNARSEIAGLMPAYYISETIDDDNVYRTGQVDVLPEWVCWDCGFRLPTEAEWEKAARGGPDQLRFPWADYSNRISHAQANYFGSFPGVDYDESAGYHPDFDQGDQPFTSPVGYFPANGYCLFDMAGNVWEWCWDTFDPDYYASAPTEDPTGPVEGSTRVVRGGGWIGGPVYCRAAYREDVNPMAYANLIGFRCVLPAVIP